MSHTTTAHLQSLQHSNQEMNPNAINAIIVTRTPIQDTNQCTTNVRNNTTVTQDIYLN